MASDPVPSRSEFETEPRELLNRGGRRNPDVYRIDRHGETLVVKDFAARGALVRATVGRLVTRREARAWHRLAGHPLVPAFRGWIDSLAFAVDYRPGLRMSRGLAGQVPDDFVDRLSEGLEEMHRRGVVHLDLRHRSNVLVDETGAPVLIDFGSAFCFRPGSLAYRFVLPILAAIDRRAVRKWRRKLTSQP